MEQSVPHVSFQTQSIEGTFSTHLAIGSFAIGTALFISHVIWPKSSEIFMAGLFYVLLAVFVNGLVMLNLVYHFICSSERRELLAIKILILLANIPIAILYFYIIYNNLFNL